VEQYCGDVMEFIKTKTGAESLTARLPQLKRFAANPHHASSTIT
jgi:hypothetical protein